MYSIILVLVLIQCLSGNVLAKGLSENLDSGTTEKTGNNSKVLLILVDGFRWDFVSRDKTLIGFPQIISKGVSAPYVKPIFPANSYPNWYSITTGRYAENHGFLQNYMYDNITHEYFWMAPNVNASHPHWWTQSEPIWITAEKSGIKTSMYLWDGCQVAFNDTKVTKCVAYHSISDNITVAGNETRSHIQKILDDFADDKYRLTLLYHESVDHTGHYWGPDSSNITEAVRDIDNILYDLYEDIAKRQLDKEVNVVIVSDHGMTILDDFKDIDLEKDVGIDFNDVEIFLGGGSGGQLAPKPGKEDEIYYKLKKVKGINVFKKDEIPDEFHYKHNSLCLELIWKSGPQKCDVNLSGYNKIAAKRSYGDHGYNASTVTDMRGIMYAFGPALKTNFKSEPLEMVDHYNLLCHILDIKPLANNGTDGKVLPMLVTRSSGHHLVHNPVIMFVMIFIAYYFCKSL